ncbi:glycosyltransferase family 2 protein [Methanobacterium sp.]|uniref:glycosyltransferase family 2 protein n=1 Tax=Methanobacterium sp. TaxID=2164 RepID=UPI003C729966
MTLNNFQVKNSLPSNRNFEENTNQNLKKSNNSMGKWNIYVVMPAYNESKTIKKVIEDLKERNLKMVIIDDGSHDKTYKIAESSIYNHGSIYRHVINRGLGAALETGIKAALAKSADIIVTFDADGQHDPNDIIPVCKPLMEKRADVVIGTRNFNKMPASKKFGNTVMNMITRIFYGIHVNDSQSGLRAFNRKAAKVLDINSRGYGVSSEIIGEIKKYNLKVEEVEIKTIYTDYSMSKGTNLMVGLKILAKLIIDILK